jgi:hypothetical protein
VKPSIGAGVVGPLASRKPTSIPGVERKRLTVGVADLKRLSPLAHADELERGVRLLQAFVAESANDRTAVLWGHGLQQDYSDMVSKTLSLSQDDLLTRCTGYLSRMTSILSSIDLEAITSAAPNAGLIGQYLRKMNSKIDTLGELDAARRELDQLLELMSASLEPLLALRDTLHQHSGRVDDLGDELQASALAALFLSDHFACQRPELSQRFLERSMSLTQTVAQIIGSTPMRTAHIEQPLAIISAIQNVALVMVPGWLGSLAALTQARMTAKKMSPTEAGELTFQLRKILKHFNA